MLHIGHLPANALDDAQRRLRRPRHGFEHVERPGLPRAVLAHGLQQAVIVRLPGFDDKIVSMYARGMSVREIQAHLRELYGIDASPDLVSAVTDAVLEEIAEWQNRPLEALYPLVFFDAIRVKIRDEGTVRNKAVYVALGVRPDGAKEILGLWIEQNEGAKFWLRVMNELRNRGVEDVLIARSERLA
jgi:putative transposase